MHSPIRLSTVTAALLAGVALQAVASSSHAQSFLDSLGRRAADGLADRAASAIERSISGSNEAPVRPNAATADRPSSGATAPSRANAWVLPTDQFAPRKVLGFWRANGSEATSGGTPSDQVPGVMTPIDLHVHHPINGPRITQAQIDALRIPLERAYAALIVQPSIADIHGASLSADINISVRPTDDGRHLVVGILTLRAKPVFLDQASTVVVNGRYQTPDMEGDVLEVTLNPYEYVARRGLRAMGTAGRVQYIEAGAQMAFIVTDQPAFEEWNKMDAALAYAGDQSWYGGSGVHPMAVTLKGASHTTQALGADQLDPGKPMSRLAAAMFMVDWGKVHAEMAGV